MYRLATRNVAVFLPCCRSISLMSPSPRFPIFISSLPTRFIRKLSTVQLIERLEYSNLLGLDSNMKNGRAALVGEFYEAWGIDACILVEYAGLNPFGGLRSDSIPRAGCPVMCIVEEVQGPTQSRSRKRRFISGHAHPGNPYVYGLAAVDYDINFPEPMPIVGIGGISHSATGYCINMVLETMKTYSSEDCLTEEAVVTKLRTCPYHHLFLHTSLRQNSSGTYDWREFGEGGLLWGECSSRHFEWFDGNPVSDLLVKVKELYGLDEEVAFRNTTVYSGNKARPLTLGTSTQIGCNMQTYEQSTPPPTPHPHTVVPSAVGPNDEVQSSYQVHKNEEKEASSRPKRVTKSRGAINRVILSFLNIFGAFVERSHSWPKDSVPKVAGCEVASSKIGEIISLDGGDDQKINSFSPIPHEFFDDMESKWKGRINRIHIDDVFSAVEKAAEALHIAVTEDFVPVISRIKATVASLGGPKGEISYSREHEAVWFKGKRFTPILWAGSPGEQQIKQLRHALGSKGKKVGEEWFTTPKVEAALTRYHEANAKAKERVLDILRGLATELQYNINILVFSSTLLIIAKALFAHASEGRRRRWVFPALVQSHGFENPRTHNWQGLNMQAQSQPIVGGRGASDVKSLDKIHGMKIVGLLPYWFHIAEDVVRNDVDMQSLFLLTGPNGGGKSSLLRSICAAALLGICGLMVPAESALIPYFDSITLHMKSYDSPADKKSSFQVEMSELRSIIGGTTKSSLVLVDEICRGTETAKGTCIAGSIIETLEKIGCLGIVSTHLHGIFILPLNIKNTVHKAMGTTSRNGQTVPTWKLTDGVCKESLAFETAKNEGMPEPIIRRAEYLYESVYAKELLSEENFPNEEKFPMSIDVNNLNGTFLHSKRSLSGANPVEVLHEEVKSAVSVICRDHVMEQKSKNIALEVTEIKCLLIRTREQPPPSVVGSSSVYVMLRPDKKLYVGETDDLEGRVRAHRLKEGMHDASFLYFLVPGKSLACQLESVLINQLSSRGYQLSNTADETDNLRKGAIV
ncbi:unnamed protein product [Sphenostylis stenocarpa]|uniref:DNA mismatch repair proteins mutS family domain-containing protein n=1 Tax=Sphenostylis stenocarpa TaxID=92480 RepID=A0AA86T4U9_9FABA|nr:unnamed protein product [Sphenostylis stenocarpa]